MRRWPVLTACSLLPLLAGCAPALTPGLANAPRLGGSAADDERVGDVVANGRDACGRSGTGGALRDQLPGCPAAESPPAASTFVVSNRTSGPGLVVRWLQHFYVGWPCDDEGQRAELKKVAWSPSAPAACGVH